MNKLIQLLALAAAINLVSGCASKPPGAPTSNARQIGEQTLNVGEGDPATTAAQVLDGLAATIRAHTDMSGEVRSRSETSLDATLDVRSAVTELRAEGGKSAATTALPMWIHYDLRPLDGGGFAVTGRTFYVGGAPLDQYPEASMFGSMLPLMMLWETAGK